MQEMQWRRQQALSWNQKRPLPEKPHHAFHGRLYRIHEIRPRRPFRKNGRICHEGDGNPIEQAGSRSRHADGIGSSVPHRGTDEKRSPVGAFHPCRRDTPGHIKEAGEGQGQKEKLHVRLSSFFLQSLSDGDLQLQQHKGGRQDKGNAVGVQGIPCVR